MRKFGFDFREQSHYLNYPAPFTGRWFFSVCSGKEVQLTQPDANPSLDYYCWAKGARTIYVAENALKNARHDVVIFLRRGFGGVK